MNHELKIWPQYYARVLDGSKTFEVRKNDRDYQPGDHVVLREWNPDAGQAPGEDATNPERAYTGRKRRFKIGYVYHVGDDQVVFSLLRSRTALGKRA